MKERGLIRDTVAARMGWGVRTLDRVLTGYLKDEIDENGNRVRMWRGLTTIGEIISLTRILELPEDHFDRYANGDPPLVTADDAVDVIAAIQRQQEAIDRLTEAVATLVKTLAAQEEDRARSEAARLARNHSGGTTPPPVPKPRRKRPASSGR